MALDITGPCGVFLNKMPGGEYSSTNDFFILGDGTRGIQYISFLIVL